MKPKCQTNQCQYPTRMFKTNLEQIEDQTVAICERALQKHWREIEHVNNKIPCLCRIALREAKSEGMLCVSDIARDALKHYGFVIPSYLSCLDSRPDNIIDAMINDTDVCKNLTEDCNNDEHIKAVICSFGKAAVSRDASTLKFIENQTEEMCLIAVAKDFRTINYAKVQTEEMCLIAVRQYGSALQFVKEQTDAVCLEAVKNKGLAICFVENKTEEICLEAVRQNGLALEYIRNEGNYLEIVMEAVKQNGQALKYAIEQTEEICLEAVRNDRYAIQYVKGLSEESYMNVLMDLAPRFPMILSYVENLSKPSYYGLTLEVIKIHGCHDRMFMKKDYSDDDYQELSLMLVRMDGLNLRYIMNQTEEICVEAFKQNTDALRCVHKQTVELCMIAIRMDRPSLKWVKCPWMTKDCEKILQEERFLKTKSARRNANLDMLIE